MIKTIDINPRNADLKITTHLYCCKYSKDYGRLIYCGGSNDNIAKVYTFKGEAVATIDKLPGVIACLDSSNKVENTDTSQLLALGGGDGVIRVFKVIYKDKNGLYNISNN